MIGGCSGSTGPASINPQTGVQYGLQFSTVTIRDMVRTQRLLLDHLDVKKLHSISGGSMGGMQAIMMDPNWNDGRYYESTIPKQGIELARMVGFITYRSEQEFAEKFGRAIQEEELLTIEGRFEIEKYLEYHGEKLAEWFDANTYLYLSKSMDLHDLGHGFSSYETGIQRIKAAVCMIGFDSDQLFPVYQQREVIGILSGTNPNAEFHEIKTLYGHDAFLLEIEKLSKIITNFLSKQLYLKGA